MSIVRVALDIPLSTLFDYTVSEVVAVGQRVIVPFGRRLMVGVVMECVATTDMAPERIKSVQQVLRDSAPLSVGLLDLLRFCSDYYRYPIGQTVLSELQEQAAGAFETVIIVDRAAGKLAAEFEEQMGFAGTYTHHVIDGDVEDPEIWHRLEAEIGFEHVVPVFVLGSGDDATNVRTAMWLTRRFPKAYVIARTFRESAFAESAARKLKFDIVSVAGLLRTSMPKRWFRFFRSLGDRLDVP